MWFSEVCPCDAVGFGRVVRTSSEALHHAASWCVAPEPPRPVHLFALAIGEDHIEGGGIDEQRLDHGHPVDVPVETRALVEAIIRLWTYSTRQDGGQDVEDEVIPQEAECDLVGVIWQCGERQLVRQRFGELYEERRSRDGITHGGRRQREWMGVTGATAVCTYLTQPCNDGRIRQKDI